MMHDAIDVSFDHHSGLHKKLLYCSLCGRRNSWISYLYQPHLFYHLVGLVLYIDDVGPGSLEVLMSCQCDEGQRILGEIPNSTRGRRVAVQRVRPREIGRASHVVLALVIERQTNDVNLGLSSIHLPNFGLFS